MEVGINWRLKRTLKNWMEDYQKRRLMRTVVKDEKSEWRENGVKGGVPQGSVLALIMFLNPQTVFSLTFSPNSTVEKKYK